MTERFGARLRCERERRQISLDAIASATKIGVALLEALERDDTSKWPPGIYRRSFIRAYATAIGLDPDPVVREFIEYFPDPAEPDRLRLHIEQAQASEPLRLQLAADAWPSSGGRTLTCARRRFSAALCDAIVLTSLGVGAFAVFGSFWAPLAGVILVYYFVGGLALGSTPAGFLLDRHWARQGEQWRRTGQMPQPAPAAQQSPQLARGLQPVLARHLALAGAPRTDTAWDARRTRLTLPITDRLAAAFGDAGLDPLLDDDRNPDVRPDQPSADYATADQATGEVHGAALGATTGF